MSQPLCSPLLFAALARTAATPASRDGLLVGLQQGSFRPDMILGEASRRTRIRCPHCRWQPGRSSRWYCLPCGHPEHFEAGCGHGWNTFDTRGRCPGCGYQWRNTSCLSCGQWSLHEDWYEPEAPRRAGDRR